MPPEPEGLLAPPGPNGRRARPQLRLVARRRLRIVDVALFYGERSGGIRTYLDAKAAHAERTGAFEHHLVIPGRHSRREVGRFSTRHELHALGVQGHNGYRVPLGAGALKARLSALRPDVVLLHDPFWSPREVTRHAQGLGAAVVMVHHGSAALDACAWPGPTGLYEVGFRAWLRRAYADADGVMSACDPFDDCRRPATVDLRFGLHPAFRPQPDLRREQHVLYAGRLAREKGIFGLFEAAARARDPWLLRVVGSGPAKEALKTYAETLGIEQRIQWRPYVRDRESLAREYAAARCVVMPGEHETFGLVAFEAAASGAAVVACETAPATRLLGSLAHAFSPGDRPGLVAAIDAARAARPDPEDATALAAEYTWEGAFRAELGDMERIVGW